MFSCHCSAHFCSLGWRRWLSGVVLSCLRLVRALKWLEQIYKTHADERTCAHTCAPARATRTCVRAHMHAYSLANQNLQWSGDWPSRVGAKVVASLGLENSRIKQATVVASRVYWQGGFPPRKVGEAIIKQVRVSEFGFLVHMGRRLLIDCTFTGSLLQ